MKVERSNDKDKAQPWITAIDYDKYAKKYSEEKTELERKLVEYTNNDKRPDKKNKILRMLLADCQINEKGLQLNLLKSFSALSRTLETQNWLRQLGSNQRPIG